MTWKRKGSLSAALVLLALVAAAGAGVHRARTYPNCRCGIPTADYQYTPHSQAVFALSLTAINITDNLKAKEALAAVKRSTAAGNGIMTEELPLPVRCQAPQPPSERARATGSTAAEPRVETKLFQWNLPGYTIDHCSISRPALQIHSDGSYTLSLRADQNLKGDLQEKRNLGDFNPFEHLKRNKFVVRLRGFASAPNAETVSNAASGKPVVLELPPIEFWVQNGQPYDCFKCGQWRGTGDAFELIDKVELEFYYVFEAGRVAEH